MVGSMNRYWSARQAILVRSRAYIETVAESPVLYLEC